ANTLLFAAAHNMPVKSYPWRFPAVVSVGSHSGADPHEFYANPDPPVEFLARGVTVAAAWLGHSTITAIVNSFATPHMPCVATPRMAGLAARPLAKVRGAAPCELKSLLRAAAGNVGRDE